MQNARLPTIHVNLKKIVSSKGKQWLKAFVSVRQIGEQLMLRHTHAKVADRLLCR